MRTLMTLITLALVLTMSTVAFAQNGVSEDFEDGSVDGGWHWSTTDFIASSGGNPGAYGACPEIWVPTPTYFGGWDAPGWTGNYTAMGVTSFSVDIQTISTQNNWFSEYPLFIAIMNHMGTPDDISDDVFVFVDPYAYYAPAGGAGWVSCQWDIPSDFVGAAGELPEGWGGGNWATPTTFPADMTWQDMMTNVGRIEIRTLEFDYFATFEPYQMGADNLVLNYDNGPVATESKSFGSVKSLYR